MTKYDHIKEMTSNNEHSEAVAELARLTGDAIYKQHVH